MSGITRSRSPRHPASPARTLWRDRLVIGGAAAPALWPVLWAMWQWRQARITALAPSWAYDIPTAEAGEPEQAGIPPAESGEGREHHIPPAEAGEGELPD